MSLSRPRAPRQPPSGGPPPDGEPRSRTSPAPVETRFGERLRAAMSGVRMRSALAAAGVVAVALAAAAGLLLVLLQRSLLGSVESSAQSRATDVARQLGAEGAAALASDLQVTASSRQFVQVLDLQGRITASSGGRAAAAPLGAARPRPGETATTTVRGLEALEPDERYVVVARGTSVRGGSYVVLVATSIEAQSETVSTVASYLVVGFPLLLVVVGGATFLFVGRSLLPVERIRRQVAGMGALQLAERVPVPATGDEIARLATTMNAMLDRLQAAHDSQRRFVADASHELRSPLAMLRASLDVAVADRSDGSWRELAGDMDVEAERMTHLVEALLLLAKADENGLRLVVVDVDLDDLVDAEARRLRSATALRVREEVASARVSGDPLKLAQAIRNLTDNAARYAHREVDIHLTTEGRWAILRVDDDGPGIPEGQREAVFDRFVRLDSSRERASGGSGLGLAIVKTIVSGHAGTVCAEGSPLGGARLAIRLPLKP